MSDLDSTDLRLQHDRADTEMTREQQLEYDLELSEAHRKHWRKRAEELVAELVVVRERAERLQEAIENENPERWSFATLLDIADIILARHYPSDVLVDRGEDVGSAFIVALRESVAVCRAVLAEQEKEQG